MDKYVIERPIMGVHLNGNEQLRTKNNKIRIFKGKISALKYLLKMYDKKYLKEQLYRYAGIQINLWEKDR